MGWEGFKNHYLLLMVSPTGVGVTKWYLVMGPKFRYNYHTIPFNNGIPHLNTTYGPGKFSLPAFFRDNWKSSVCMYTGERGG